MARVLIVGCAEAGAGWAARLALHGVDVAILDPDPKAQARLAATLPSARRWLPMLQDGPLPVEGRVEFVQDLEIALQSIDLAIFFGKSDRLAQQRTAMDRLAAIGLPVVVAVSETGTQDLTSAPDVSAHPVWLLPVALLEPHGKFDGHHSEIVGEILIWSGVFPVLRAPHGRCWLTGDATVTDLSAEAALAACSGLIAACAIIPEPDRAAALTGLLRSLKDRDLGLGRLLNLLDRRRGAALSVEAGDLVRMQVLPAWIDYNGHMTESRYLFACSEVTDAFLRRIGAGLDSVATGFSYYSAETHIRHLGESKLGDLLSGRVQVLAADPKRLHLFTTLCRGADVVATLEQMLLHVDMQANRACPAHPTVLERLMPIAAAHAALPLPQGAGRHVGQRRES